MSRAGHASSSAVAPKQTCRVPHTAASCAAVYGARRSGGTVRSAWLARGAAQKLRRSTADQAAWEAGEAARLRFQVFQRPRHGRTLACLWGCPERRSHIAVGAGPVATPDLGPQFCDSGRRRATFVVENSRLAQVGGYAGMCLDLSCHQIQGGTCTGWFRQKDIEVIEKRNERFTLPQLRISPSRRSK